MLEVGFVPGNNVSSFIVYSLPGVDQNSLYELILSIITIKI